MNVRKALGGALIRLGRRIARPTVTEISDEIVIFAGGGGGGATFQSFPVSKLPRETDGTIKPIQITVGKGGKGGVARTFRDFNDGFDDGPAPVSC